MKFNEKLIELRKKQGLSQEELGYKLNVTRQTVSKWELGQTTPEMDKLVEMSKIFNVTVDELINESEVATNVNPIIEDQPIEKEKTKNNKFGIIIVVALIIVALLIVLNIASENNAVDKGTENAIENVEDSQENIIERFFGLFERFFDLFEKAMDSQENMIENSTGMDENTQNMVGNIIENSFGEINKGSFNGFLELYNGSNSASQLKSLLEEVITINKTEDRKITVKYLETETQDTEEIKNLKMSIKDSNNFEATFDYDEEGYINKVTIEQVVSQFEISSFNSALELYAGSKNGMIVTNVLDKIITSNKTEGRKITVKYSGTETQDETEIKNIKRNFGTFDNCEITYEYDADGFINKAIIEKF